MNAEQTVTYERFTASKRGTIMRDNGVDVMGADFRAVNYGRLYGRLMNNGVIKVRIQESVMEGGLSYTSDTPEELFPYGAQFYKCGGRGFRELEHLYALNKRVGGVDAIKTEMHLEDFVRVLQDAGMRLNK